MNISQVTLSNGVTANTVGPGQCWRLVHNGTKVLQIFESVGITYTKQNLWASDETSGPITGPLQLGDAVASLSAFGSTSSTTAAPIAALGSTPQNSISGLQQALAQIAALGLAYTPPN